MELSQIDPVSHQTRPDEPELDLYTIPIHSSWFVWDEVHETERASLREFFEGGSIARTPKIYKEYRDFIINKYREEPSRRLKFTEVRKCLVGDVNLIHKVFLFLEKWGLINFSPPPSGAGDGSEARGAEEEGLRVRVKVEEGVPNGIRVVATPNSIKPMSAEPTSAAEDRKVDLVSASVDSGITLPPLASYSDVFVDLIRQNDGIVCGNCGDHCNSGHYKHNKDDFSICATCFESGKYGENKSVDDYKFSEGIQRSCKYGAVWSEAETLLLLESVLKYGDNWELVTQNLPTKTKLDCIAKLIELPLGEVLGFGMPRKGHNSNDLAGSANSSTQDPSPSSENQEMLKVEDRDEEKMNDVEQNGEAAEQGPPLKRQRITPVSGSGGSLMEQVACISTMVDPCIASAAAEAAVTSLCEENSWPREIFDADDDDDDDSIIGGVPNSTADSETNRGVEVEGSDIEGGPAPSENQESSTKKDEIPISLRIRTAVATALGAAAARAKLLADQEEREIENLVATVIGTEMKKVHRKIRHFEDLEVIMKKQQAEMAVIEDMFIGEEINVLRAAFKAGIPRWKEFPALRS